MFHSLVTSIANLNIRMRPIMELIQQEFEIYPDLSRPSPVIFSELSDPPVTIVEDSKFTNVTVDWLCPGEGGEDCQEGEVEEEGGGGPGLC